MVGSTQAQFLAVAYEHISRNMGKSPAATEIDTLKHDTFFGREKENLVFPIALANLVLHGIDQPNLWHGNTLTKRATYAALFDKAPKFFDVILTNPPFGGKEGKDAQKNYAYATGSTQVLFVQDILGELATDGRCAIVLDDGFLFRKDEDAFVERAAREAEAKASAIDAAVFDLKAVNPNAIVKIDTRTPVEVIQSIDDQGKIVADALETLRGLLQA